MSKPWVVAGREAFAANERATAAWDTSSFVKRALDGEIDTYPQVAPYIAGARLGYLAGLREGLSAFQGLTDITGPAYDLVAGEAEKFQRLIAEAEAGE